VYEEKEKDGKVVKKVRLVDDGRTHYGATTPIYRGLLSTGVASSNVGT
jgi:hypothetical protein